MAPVTLRKKLEGLILREIEHARQKHKARLIFKLNSLVDPHMIQLLYQASQAGVQVDLLVRGMCCLRPSIKGVSENIRVISIVGRYLEHSRLFYFHNDRREEIYLGSADLMPRNLNHRVEVVFPVENKDHIHYLRHRVLDTYLKDNTRARILQSDGAYTRLTTEAGKDIIDVQEKFMS